MNQGLVNVIGAGLAGSEAAWQIARRGVRVRLHEMRPLRMTEAHQTGMFGELVCSNSLRNDSMETAVGVLKEEMRRLGSLIIATAHPHGDSRGASARTDRTGRGNGAAAGDHYRCDRTAYQSGIWRRAQPNRRRAQSLFLRCHRTDRDRVVDRYECRLHGIALGQGR
jgi:choline dehydrogenase-like flavoprotein